MPRSPIIVMPRLVRGIQRYHRASMAGEPICIVAIGWRELDAPRHAKRAEPVLGPASGRTRGHDKRGMTI